MQNKQLEHPLSPGSTLGILGGGQLGRMLAQAAQSMGYKVHIFCPEADAPALDVTPFSTVAAYDDVHALADFAESVDVVTYEFENIPLAAVQTLSALVPVYPDTQTLAICQHRAREKNAVQSYGLRTAPFAFIEHTSQLDEAVKTIRTPAILKTAESGYDGKGQARIHSLKDAQDAFARFGNVPCVLEGLIDFVAELSVIVARGVDGKAVAYEVGHNVHKHHILDTTTLPAPLDISIRNAATGLAVTIAEGINLRGIIAIELFALADGTLLVNELAPRPHNSGHWTMDASVTSQFEQTARAVLGLPLGAPDRLCDVTMHNLIGDDVRAWKEILENPHAKLHLYGKKEARDARKMGHVNELKA